MLKMLVEVKVSANGATLGFYHESCCESDEDIIFEKQQNQSLDVFCDRVCSKIRGELYRRIDKEERLQIKRERKRAEKAEEKVKD